MIDELEIRSQDQGIGLTYIYLDYKDQDRQSPLNIIASFLKQLACRVDEVIPELLSLYKLFRTRGKQPELTHLLEALVSASGHFQSCYVIIDALDECDKKHRIDLLSVIGRLSEANFKVFTTSRPHPHDILRFVENIPTLTIYADTDDIKNFLSVQLDTRLLHHQDLKGKIVTKLSLGAHGV